MPKKKTSIAYAKGEYVIWGSSQKSIRDRVDKDLPGPMTPSVPEPITKKKATLEIQDKKGNFRKKYNWIGAKPIKMPKVKNRKLGRVHRGRGGLTRRR
jgi:hypothetical protein